MDRQSAEQVARDLLVQHATKQPFASLKARLAAPEDAYDVQDAYVAMLLGRAAGYKIGLTSQKMQALCGIDEPIAGVVFNDRVRQSGATIGAGAYGRLGLESELCVVLDRDLDGDCSRADVESSLRSIHAAFEVIDDRGADYAHLDGPSLVADNSWNEGVVIGGAAAPARDLTALRGTLSIDGAVADSGSTGDAMGHPLDVVVWLARRLARRGERVRAGQLVMTGSIVTSKFPKPGESYRSRGCRRSRFRLDHERGGRTMTFDLGITGRTAIVCGASSGLGKACATALGQAGVDLVINGRDAGRLEAAAADIRAATGAAVRLALGDVATREGRAAIIEACPDPDILVNNAGGPPPGDFREWDEEEWIAALRTNMLAAIMMIRGVVDGMIARRWGRIINITSQTVKMPLPLIGLSNGARAGLTGFIAGLSREVAQHGVTINNLLPGYFETERLRTYAARVGASRGQSADETIAEMAATNPARRIGRPPEFGAWCAFLASEHAGYATGQNFVLDGGAYPGTL